MTSSLVIVQVNESMGFKCNSEIDYLPNMCNVLDFIVAFQDEQGWKTNPVISYGIAYRKAGSFTEASKFTQPPFLTLRCNLHFLLIRTITYQISWPGEY